MGFTRSDTDPCIYFKWYKHGIILWMSCIDDCMLWAPAEISLEEKNKFLQRFDCDDLGELTEYVGCKIYRDKKKRTLRFTQPVLIQSFEDQFDLEKKNPVIPAEAGTTLVKADTKDKVENKRHKYFRSGVGKLLYLQRWSRPDVSNSARELARQGSAPVEAHIKSMHRLMKYCVNTSKRGCLLKPKRSWNGLDTSHKFEITGWSDSDDEKCPITRRSVSGYASFLEGVPVTAKSIMQKVVALSVTEAELIAAVQCVQDMLYVKKIIESIGLKAKLPMIINIDNSGAVDLINNWSISRRTRHMDTKVFFIR